MSTHYDCDFERIAAQEPRTGLLREFWDLLRYNKKWWLLPILAVLLAAGALLVLSNTAIAPFVYTLF